MQCRRQLEDEMDQRTAELIALRKAAVEQVASGPSTPKGQALQTALGPWAALPATSDAPPAPSPSQHTFSTSGSPAALRCALPPAPPPLHLSQVPWGHDGMAVQSLQVLYPGCAAVGERGRSLLCYGRAAA